MSDFNYNQIIEYLDGTYDEHFNNAKKWAKDHNTTFEEVLEMRQLPERFFKIGEEYVPSVEEKKQIVRAVRNSYLENTDKYMLIDFPISDEEREQYKQYRQYLRNYTDGDNWWNELPKTFEEWKHEC